MLLKGIKGVPALLSKDDVSENGIRMVREPFADETYPAEKLSHAKSLEKLTEELCAFLGSAGAATAIQLKKRNALLGKGGEDEEDDEVDATADAVKHLLK